jgi:hypothetical protein
MCSIKWHICECGSEWNCNQKNADCPTFNGFGERCFHCEYAHEEEMREQNRDQEQHWIDGGGESW